MNRIDGIIYNALRIITALPLIMMIDVVITPPPLPPPVPQGPLGPPPAVNARVSQPSVPVQNVRGGPLPELPRVAVLIPAGPAIGQLGQHVNLHRIASPRHGVRPGVQHLSRVPVRAAMEVARDVLERDQRVDTRTR